jgi:hypothetical protein
MTAESGPMPQAAEQAGGESTVVGLKDAIRQARIEAADRTAVVVDMRDADVARLELLNEALDPVFADIPSSIDLFDRGVARGDTPRLWIDVVAHVHMGRDKRVYRFVQDTRHGRKVLAESLALPDVVTVVTRYVARRMVERERALAEDPFVSTTGSTDRVDRRRGRGRAFRFFVLGVIAGAAALFAAAWIYAAQL